MTILRLWSGWADGDRADRYDEPLNRTIAPAIVRRDLAGLAEFTVWRRRAAETDGPDEFLTAMTFEDYAAIRAFTGRDESVSVVPDAARALLDRHDEQSRHYELVHRHR